MNSTGTLPEVGKKVFIKMNPETITDSFFVKPKHTMCRRNGTGTYNGIVPGAGGDVWWIHHDDGTIGAYCYDELFYTKKEADEAYVSSLDKIENSIETKKPIEKMDVKNCEESCEKIIQYETPKSAGYFWARNGDCKWFDLIVEIYGKSPFFRLRAWDLKNSQIVDIEAQNIKWGPEILCPDVVELKNNGL